MTTEENELAVLRAEVLRLRARVADLEATAEAAEAMRDRSEDR